MPDKSDKSKKLHELLEDIADEVDGDSTVAVKDILDAFGSRSFGPLIAMPALVAITPVGAIPTVPTVLAVFVFLVAVQHLVGRNHPWMPGIITKRSIEKDTWVSARKKVEPWVKRIDKVLQPRLMPLTTGVMDRVVSVVIIALALMMPPLELLPFAVVAPGAALFMFGLALSARDGVLVIIGLLISAVSVYLLYLALWP